MELEHCENIKMINHLNLENDQLKEHLKIKKEEIANVKERVEVSTKSQFTSIFQKSWNKILIYF